MGTSMHRIAEFTEHCERVGMTEEYWLLGFHGDVDVPQVQVFYEKDFNEVKYEELKALVKNRFNEDRKEDNSSGR